MTPLEFALDYANHGFPVIPLHTPNDKGKCDCLKADCKSPAKHPRNMKGLSEATTDQKEINRWWSLWPTANVGLVVPEGYVVVDIDTEEVQEALGGRSLPPTATAKTGHGWHYVYKTQQRIAPAVGILENVDLRGPGSYIVVEPSRHISGWQYRWLAGLDETTEAPRWIVGARNTKTQEPLTASEPIIEGNRNATLTRLAGMLRRPGFSVVALEAALLAENAARCNPPLPEDEVRTIARSVGRYAPTEEIEQIKKNTQVPPQSIEAEESVLGALLVDRDVMAEVSEMLLPSDFYDHRHGVIFSAMVRLFNRKAPIDVVTVVTELRGMGNLDDIGGRGLLEMLAKGARSYRATDYAEIVRQKSVYRQLIATGNRITEVGYSEPETVEEAFDRAESEMTRLRTKAPTGDNEADPTSIIVRMETENTRGISTRIPTFNHWTTGLVKGQVVVIGGFSSTGKSAAVVNLADDVLQYGGTAMIASTEMSKSQYMIRLLALASDLPQSLVRHGGMNLFQSGQYDRAKEIYKNSKLRIYDDLYNVTKIRRRAKMLKQQIGLDVMFVDFLQNLNDTGDETKDMRISIIQLQALAKELDCCIVALSQVSNEMAKMQNDEGGFGNYYAFKGSGAIKDAADVAVMLTRDRVNKPDVLWWNVVKNRHGEMGRIATRIFLDTGKIEQMDDDEARNADPNSGRRQHRKPVEIEDEEEDLVGTSA